MSATAATAPLLSCRGLTRHFRVGDSVVRAVDGVDLELSSGETLALVGPSGSGKSTLLALLGGLERPTAGTVLLEGREIFGLPDRSLAAQRNRTIGFVFQAFHLAGHLSALENVTLPLMLAEVRRSESRGRAEEMLERVGLSGRLHHSPERLSGGERQRVAVARALVMRPRLILADEPTGQLDSETGRQILDLLLALGPGEGAALVVATHDPEVARLMSRGLRLHDGRFAAEGRP